VSFGRVCELTFDTVSDNRRVSGDTSPDYLVIYWEIRRNKYGKR
jgi:hypothetical protein